MVNPRWSFRPRRHYYLVSAAGLIAASGWFLFEPLSGAMQHVSADASNAYTQPDTDSPYAQVNDAPAMAAVQCSSVPRLLAATVRDPAGDSLERRLAALVQAPKHGPPL